jgi:hypothetical protein
VDESWEFGFGEFGMPFRHKVEMLTRLWTSEAGAFIVQGPAASLAKQEDKMIF